MRVEPVEIAGQRAADDLAAAADRTRQYIIGVDPAGGGSEGDYACAQVIDRETGLQCAELHGHFPPRELARRAGRSWGRRTTMRCWWWSGTITATECWRI